MAQLSINCSLMYIKQLNEAKTSYNIPMKFPFWYV